METPSDVEYRWDTDTDILTANLRARAVSEGASGSVEIEGSRWLVADSRPERRVRSRRRGRRVAGGSEAVSARAAERGRPRAA